jgi:hypothetical protein
MAHCFRIRFRLGEHVGITSDDAEWVLTDPAVPDEVILLRPTPDPVESIGAARELSLFGSGYASEPAAQAASKRWRDVLHAAFARFAIGADFGERAPGSAFTEYGLRTLEAQLGRRVLNDVHGIMTFECDPRPTFVNQGMEMTVGHNPESLRRAIDHAASIGLRLTPQQRVSFDLYSASFFLPVADARFLMLMMAVETLITLEPRSDEEQGHIATLIAATRSSGLEKAAIHSMISTLGWVKYESISQAGRRLAASLGERLYAGERPVAFFTGCYELRSALVHGKYPRPSRDQVDIRAATLEHFVGHLICGPLLESVTDD